MHFWGVSLSHSYLVGGGGEGDDNKDVKNTVWAVGDEVRTHATLYKKTNLVSKAITKLIISLCDIIHGIFVKDVF